MIFYWLALAWRKLRWFFTPPTAAYVARVRPDHQCPICGARRKGPILCVRRRVGPKEFAIVAEHTCAICGARWYEKPIVKIGPDRVWPAVPRTEVEQAAATEISLWSNREEEVER